MKLKNVAFTVAYAIAAPAAVYLVLAFIMADWWPDDYDSQCVLRTLLVVVFITAILHSIHKFRKGDWGYE